MKTHVIKFTHFNGVKLASHRQVLWCGRHNLDMKVVFTDAQHVLLSALAGDSWGRPICPDCLKAIKAAADCGLRSECE